MTLTPDELHAYALEGARATLQRIYAAFPPLAPGKAPSVPVATPSDHPQATTPKRHTMSAAERQAVSERMRRYWAERRKQGARKSPAARKGKGR